MATKHGKVVTCRAGLSPITHRTRGHVRSRDKLKSLFLRQSWQEGDLK